MSNSIMDEYSGLSRGEIYAKRRVSELRLEELRKLDATQVQRDELAADGVSDARIKALYPFDFGEYIDGLIPLISPTKLTVLTGKQDLFGLMKELDWAADAATAGAKELLRQQNTAEFRRKMTQLAIVIAGFLPATIKTEEAVDMGQLLSIMLWRTMTFAANPELMRDAASAHILFLKLTDLLLPHLREQESALIAQIAALGGPEQ